MRLVTVDPLTALAIAWLRGLISDWSASAGRLADPDGSAADLSERAAGFFRKTFPRLAAAAQADLAGAAPGDPFIAAVFSADEMAGGVARVAQWAEVFDIPVPRQAAECLAYQLGQHFAGVMLDALAGGALPGVEPGAALRHLLCRLVPAGPTVPLATGGGLR